MEKPSAKFVLRSKTTHAGWLFPLVLNSVMELRPGLKDWAGLHPHTMILTCSVLQSLVFVGIRHFTGGGLFYRRKNG